MSSVPPDDPSAVPRAAPTEEETLAREAAEEDAAAEALPGEARASTPEESVAAVEALVTRPDTRARVRGVIVRVSKARIADDELENLASDAIARALEKATTLRSPERAWGWLSTIAGNRAKQWVRKDALERDAVHDPRLHGPVAAAVSGGSDPWSLVDWLRARVTPRERATLALLLEHAESGRPVAEIAAARGDSANAAYKKIGSLKAKYAAELEAERAAGIEPRRRSLLWALLLLAAASYVIWRLLAPGAPPAPPRILAPSAAPSAPTPVPTSSFEPALPPTIAPSAPDVPAKPGR